MFWQHVVLESHYGIPWCDSAFVVNGDHLGTAEKEVHFVMILTFSSELHLSELLYWFGPLILSAVHPSL